MTRILVAQNNTTVGDFKGNTDLLINSITHAKSKKCSLVVSSELALSGYPPNDLLNYPHFLEENEKAIERVLKAAKGITVLVGCIRKNEEEGQPLHNSALVLRDQKILATYDKCLLPTYDVFDERRYFEPGKKTLIFEHEGKKIAVSICEDIWEEQMNPLYPFNPLDYLVEDAPDLLVNLSSSPFELDKLSTRLNIGKRAAQKLKCPVLYCNQVGGNDDLIFDGASFICDSKQLLSQASAFKEESWVVDLKKLSRKKRTPLPQEEQLYEALVLGIRDFFHKQGFEKALIGLSGGIDSALVAVLLAHALGKKNVLALSMPSRFSSKGSVLDAQKLSKNLGIELREIPIESIHDPFLQLLSPEFKGLPEDVTEENIQARIRGVILMAFSNKLKSLVITCGNKSEMAMGYATLYGDLAGGLAPISDLTKSQVYALSKWINKKNKIIPKSILTKPPSAELRPNQKDSDSLPDYDLLDQVIENYVQNHLSPQEIAEKLKQKPALIQKLIQKIHFSEYKRRQTPIGLKVTSKAFSAGWRFPIVQNWTP